MIHILSFVFPRRFGLALVLNLGAGEEMERIVLHLVVSCSPCNVLQVSLFDRLGDPARCLTTGLLHGMVIQGAHTSRHSILSLLLHFAIVNKNFLNRNSFPQLGAFARVRCPVSLWARTCYVSQRNSCSHEARAITSDVLEAVGKNVDGPVESRNGFSAAGGSSSQSGASSQSRVSTPQQRSYMRWQDSAVDIMLDMMIELVNQGRQTSSSDFQACDLTDVTSALRAAEYPEETAHVRRK